MKRLLQKASKLSLYMQQLCEAFAKGEVVSSELKPGQARDEFVKQLKYLQMRLKQATNQNEGGQAFIDDVQQIVLWLQNVKEAWPLNTTEHVGYRKYIPGECEQTLYDC